LEQAGQLVEQLGAAVHEVAAGLDQRVEVTGLVILQFQRAEFGGVIAHQFQKDARVGPIVAGARGREGRAVAGAGDRIDGIDFQPGILQESREGGAAFAFQARRTGRPP